MSEELLDAEAMLNPKALKAIYERFKDQPPEVIQDISFQQGLTAGRALLKQMGITGNDLGAISALVGAVVAYEPMAEVEVTDDELHLRNKGFCPLMSTCLSLNLPWEWMCPNVGWPFFRGLGVAVNPDTSLNIVKWRYRGDPYCDHIYEIAPR